MKKFLVVDDHNLFLEGMCFMLNELEGHVQVDTASSVERAITLLEQKDDYDLLLADISLPEMDGFSLLQSLNQRAIVLPIMMVSSTSDIGDIRRCLELGASGFIHKNAAISEMLDAVIRVLAGNIVLPENISSQLDMLLRPNTKELIIVPVEHKEIGERQIEVLNLMDSGMSNKQIAKVLAISEATVKYHIGILFKQLGAKNRTSCLLKAREKRILNHPN